MLTSPTSPYVGAPIMISSTLTNKMLTPCINKYIQFGYYGQIILQLCSIMIALCVDFLEKMYTLLHEFQALHCFRNLWNVT